MSTANLSQESIDEWVADYSVNPQQSLNQCDLVPFDACVNIIIDLFSAKKMTIDMRFEYLAAKPFQSKEK